MAMALPRMGVVLEVVEDDDLGMAMAGGLVSLSFSHSKWIEGRSGGCCGWEWQWGGFMVVSR
jgi:hypothetical protein